MSILEFSQTIGDLSEYDENGACKTFINSLFSGPVLIDSFVEWARKHKQKSQELNSHDSSSQEKED